MCRRVWRTVSSASSKRGAFLLSGLGTARGRGFQHACFGAAGHPGRIFLEHRRDVAGHPRAAGNVKYGTAGCEVLEHAAYDAPGVIAEQATEPALAVVVPPGGADRQTLAGLAEVGVGHRVVAGDRGVVDTEGRQPHVPPGAVLAEDVVVEDDRQAELVVVVDTHAPCRAVVGDGEAPGGAVVAGHVEAPGRAVMAGPVVLPIPVALVLGQGRPCAGAETEPEGQDDDSGSSCVLQCNLPLVAPHRRRLAP